MKGVEIVIGGSVTIVTYLVLSTLFVLPLAALLALIMGTAITTQIPRTPYVR